MKLVDDDCFNRYNAKYKLANVTDNDLIKYGIVLDENRNELAKTEENINKFGITILGDSEIWKDVDRLGHYDFCGSSFYRLEHLKSITIPKSVKCFEGYSISECPNLESITILGNQHRHFEFAFMDNRSLKKVSFVRGQFSNDQHELWYTFGYKPYEEYFENVKFSYIDDKDEVKEILANVKNNLDKNINRFNEIQIGSNKQYEETYNLLKKMSDKITNMKNLLTSNEEPLNKPEKSLSVD